jgi:hypothetical protein
MDWRLQSNNQWRAAVLHDDLVVRVRSAHVCHATYTIGLLDEGSPTLVHCCDAAVKAKWLPEVTTALHCSDQSASRFTPVGRLARPFEMLQTQFAVATNR